MIDAFGSKTAPQLHQVGEKSRSLIDATAAKSPVPDGFFAVRSSSPKEGLDGNSFAGGYETAPGFRRRVPVGYGATGRVGKAIVSCRPRSRCWFAACHFSLETIEVRLSIVG